MAQGKSTELTYKGKTQTLTEWAHEYEIEPGTLRMRLAKGWPVADAIETPVGEPRPSAAAEKPAKPKRSPPAAKKNGHASTLRRALVTVLGEGVAWAERVKRQIERGATTGVEQPAELPAAEPPPPEVSP